MENPKILIIDLSSQVASLIGTTLRDLKHRSAIFGPDGAKKWLKKHRPKGIILSGGEQSVYDESALTPPEEILDIGIPIFGICFGMQWLAYKMGGRVVPNTDTDKLENKNYGDTSVKFLPGDRLFRGLSKKELTVWASHGDSVEGVPSGFEASGWFSPSGAIAAIANDKKRLYAVQYHPEVKHTQELAGKEILRRFVEDVCGCEKDWSEENFIDKTKDEIRYVVKDDKATLAYSGGVDSSLTLVMVHEVLGERLHTFCIDTGALRAGEIYEIVSNAKATGITNVKVLFMAREFFTAIGKAIDAEKKRLRFRSVYGPLLDREGKAFGAKFIFQGTNKADKIESGKEGRSSHIKSHHNLVETELEKFNPLQDLFKYEIRALAYKIGLPKEIAERKPFPGPGLFLRVNGIPATPGRVVVVQWADTAIMRILKKYEVYDEISQCPVSLNGVPTVGIKGDKRAYKYSIIYHPVQTLDFMTSQGYFLSEQIQREIIRVVTKHPEVVRVLPDFTPKPPASTEWE